MAFTDELWREIEPIYTAILRHPFLRGLTEGSLPRESFRFYAVQDALYLREFARALSLAAARAPDDDWIVMFNEHAAGALRVVRAVLAATDAVAARLPPAGRETMQRHVLTTSRYEWMFWDMGWRLETWPV